MAWWRRKVRGAVGVVFAVASVLIGGFVPLERAAAATPLVITPSARPLSLGSSGADVRSLQQTLLWLGFLSGSPSGTFGTQTRTAVSAFQTWAKIPVTGSATVATLKSLNLSTAAEPKGTVLVVGDSMAREVRIQLTRNVVAKGYRLVGFSGVGTLQMIGFGPFVQSDGRNELRRHIDAGVTFTHLLVLVGSNEVLYDSHVGTWTDVGNQIEQFMAAVPNGVAVHWMNLWVRDFTTTVGVERNEWANARQFNRMLSWSRSETPTRPSPRFGARRIVVLDWFGFVEANPQAVSDFVHAGPTYLQRYADIATSAL